MIIFLVFLALVPTVEGANVKKETGRDLILIAGVNSDENDYYATRGYAKIVEFQANFVKEIADNNTDNVLIFADDGTYSNLEKDHGFNSNYNWAVYSTPFWPNRNWGYFQDIWIRDYGLVDPEQRILFKYKPNSQSASISKAIQNGFKYFFNDCPTPKMTFKKRTKVIFDGGNYVSNNPNDPNEPIWAVVTDRLFKDNWKKNWKCVPFRNCDDNKKCCEDALKNYIEDNTKVDKLVVIPEYPGDTTGHSDGMVAFLDAKVIAIDSMPKKPQLKQTIIDYIKGNFSGIKVVELNSVYKEETFEGFGGACGLHINMLTTTNAIYVPTFAQVPDLTAAKDREIVDLIIENTSKKVVEIPVPHEVCRLGGSVRCLSMNIASGTFADNLIQSQAEDAPCF